MDQVMMPERPSANERNRAPLWLKLTSGLGPTSVLAAYLVFRSPTLVHHLEWHAMIAAALGPVTALLSLAAVIAALWSVELQRRAVAGQQDEIERHMGLLEDQRVQFAKSAQAQESLAEAQRNAVREQARSNDESAALRLAQHSSTIATLMASATQLAFERARERATRTWVENAMSSEVEDLMKKLNERLLAEQHCESQLRMEISQAGLAKHA